VNGPNETGGPPDHGALLQRALVALDEMEAKLAASERRGHEPIAIVGMGLRFPGGAVDPDSFWELLTSGRDAVTDIPADRWDVEAMFDPNPDARAKSYTRWGGFLDDVDRFDPAFFGISPREALSMDPQQRILLEVAWEALEDAAIAAPDLAGTATGVFIGMIGTEYSALALRGGVMDDVDAYFASGVAHSIAAGRLAYALDLRGPAVAVDTACSSSLVSTHMACQSLRSGESDIALAGGVNVMLSPDAHIMTSQARMMSFEGRCKTFDAAADGYVRGEGCAFVVLKRLDDALAAGDRVVATIRGTAANQDGRTNGLTAPNAAAQEAVIRAALADGAVSPSQVGFVECHGTGTTLGDPIEIGALQAVFGAGRPDDRPLRVQSVKTNIGHLEGAAGIAGLCKLALAVERGGLPAHLHLTEPNPYIPWRDIAVAPASGPEPWEADPGGRRIGGVSSFGFSGTNVHMVLEQAPPAADPIEAPSERRRPARPRGVYVVSGRTPEALERVAAAHAAALAQLAPADWPDAAATAALGRAHLDERLAVVAGAAGEAATLLGRAASSPTPDVVRGRRVAGDDGLVMLFTGQGSQRPGMGRRLYETEPAFRGALDECARLFADIGGFALLDAMFADAAGSFIHDTAYTQPCLFAYEVALAELWRSWGVEPAACSHCRTRSGSSRRGAG
jgi:acyl transferase domain-containing protein